jgi:CheY-like chemotaxis protein
MADVFQVGISECRVSKIEACDALQSDERRQPIVLQADAIDSDSNRNLRRMCVDFDTATDRLDIRLRAD